MSGARRGQHRAQHLFRARLADAPGHGDDACAGPPSRLPRERVQSLQRIRHAKERAGRGCRLESLVHDSGGSALIDGGFGEPMPIHALAPDGEEQIAAFHSAAVDGDAVHRNAGRVWRRSFQRRRDFPGGPKRLSHGFVPRVDAASAAATAS